MSFDVGQHVSTPEGPALVTSVNWQSMMVRTDRGTFPEESLLHIDREALRDPEMLEAWLDGAIDLPLVPPSLIESVSVPCACDCGRVRGSCHHLEHINIDGDVVGRFPHATITTACRCVATDCMCV